MQYLNGNNFNLPEAETGITGRGTTGRGIYWQLVRGIITTHPDEIGCDECFELLDRFAEMTLAGIDASHVLPLVQDHLNHCRDCREEFMALLAALYAPA